MLAGAVPALAVTGHAVSASSTWSPGPASWTGDLAPIAAADWSYDRAAHLLGRAGFSGTPEEIRELADMTPEQAVRSLVYYDHIANDHLQPFMHSGFWDETLIPFPPSRPAATDLAIESGESMGVRVKPEHVNRHVQPVSDRFFYWLRATTRRDSRVRTLRRALLRRVPGARSGSVSMTSAASDSIFVVYADAKETIPRYTPQRRERSGGLRESPAHLPIRPMMSTSLTCVCITSPIILGWGRRRGWGRRGLSP